MISVKLPFNVSQAILACGADLKGAFAFAHGKEAFVIDGFGDLSDIDNFSRYEETINAHARKFGFKNGVVACDLHSGYFSTRYAKNSKLRSSKLIKIQHHEAHTAAAIIYNSIKGAVIGVAFDGTGFGSDGNIWGGEFFTGDIKTLKRAAHLDHIPMPGSDMAIKEPWRMAASYLYDAFGDKFTSLDIGFVKGMNKDSWRILKKMIDGNINCALTSSAGRLFDAVSSLVLARYKVSREAELPIEFERITGQAEGSYDFDIIEKDVELVVSVKKAIKGIVKDIRKGLDAPSISAKFHNTVVEIICGVCAFLRKRLGIDTVTLSGGVFQNRYVKGRATIDLEKAGFKVYALPEAFINDSSIPLGQIAVAASRAV